ncbi:MAG: hypothetical protein Q8L14_15440 [Myxococcales bacterium]|nr:hypothetical protein [Myxococcales bacterium]
MARYRTIAALLGTAVCACPAELRPEFEVVADPATISASRASTAILLRARTERGSAGVGTVALTAASGRFDGTLVTLDQDGVARVGFHCDPTTDAQCRGVIVILARWVERELEASTTITVEPMIDASFDAGGSVDSGSADASIPDGGRDAGLGDAGLADAGPRDAGQLDGGVADAGAPVDAGPPLPPTFDFRDMVLLGTTDPGYFDRQVVCNLNTPWLAHAGFSRSSGYPPPSLASGRPTVRPSDGALYYLDGDVVRRFVGDELITQRPFAYPQMPQDNDPAVQTPGCGAQAVTSFAIRPDGGIIHRCGITAWRDSAGAVVRSCPFLLAMSNEGASYCRDSLEQVIDPSGVLHPMPGVPAFTVVRSRPDGGFWATLRFGNYERWSISPVGVATRDGVYAPAPAGAQLVNTDGPGYVGLDGHANAYRLYFEASGTSVETIVQFSADFSTSSVVYSEGDAGVMCKFHGSSLLTGP